MNSAKSSASCPPSTASKRGGQQVQMCQRRQTRFFTNRHRVLEQTLNKLDALRGETPGSHAISTAQPVRGLVRSERAFWQTVVQFRRLSSASSTMRSGGRRVSSRQEANVTDAGPSW